MSLLLRHRIIGKQSGTPVDNRFVTEWNLPSGNFTFPAGNTGTYNALIDWGDGSALSEITAYNDGDLTHNYASAGTYQIKVSGTFPWFYINNTGIKSYLTKVINWGNVGFLSFQNSFYGANNLNSLPVGSMSGNVSTSGFNSTFRNCTGLTSIPSGLFDNNVNVSTNGFRQTFFNCTGLTSIPAGLFDNNVNVSIYGFYYTFYNCTGLTSIPAGLFDNNVNVSTYGFGSTFYDCTGLTSIPAGLFKYNVNCTEFNYTFYNTPKAQLNRNIFFEDSEINTRFLNKTVNFSNCFKRDSFTGNQGEAPELWDCDFGAGTPTTAGCYGGAGNSTTSLTNYNDIPAGWK